MKSFQYYPCTFVLHGPDVHHQIGKMAADFEAERVLVLYGSNRLSWTGFIESICGQCLKEGMKVRRMEGAAPDPRYSHVLRMIEAVKPYDPDLIIACGGGSVIDCAKAMALGLANPDVDLWKIWTREITDFKPARGVGVLCTHPGSGSDMSDTAVLLNEKLRCKYGFTHTSLRPCFTALNPILCVSLPDEEAAGAVCSILIRNLDRYFSHDPRNVMTDALTEAVMRTVLEQGPIFYDCRTHFQSASELMWASSLTSSNLTGLGRQKDFSVHLLANAVCGRFNLRQAEALTAIFPSWARYAMPCNYERAARLGRQVFSIEETDDIKAAKACIDAIEAFFVSLDMPVTLEQALPRIEFDDQLLDELAAVCSYHGTRTIGRFFPMDEKRMRRCYGLAVKGCPDLECPPEICRKLRIECNDCSQVKLTYGLETEGKYEYCDAWEPYRR